MEDIGKLEMSGFVDRIPILFRLASVTGLRYNTSLLVIMQLITVKRVKLVVRRNPEVEYGRVVSGGCYKHPNPISY